jgi:hypothetical protein
MFRRYAQIPGQLEFGEPSQPSPAVRRALRRGPSLRMRTRPAPDVPQQPAPAPRTLTEWHAMTSGELVTAWAGLRAWVSWLHDRYELATEERLPRCWPQHPGLIEELYALKTWREEIYSTGQPSGQAARYWHAELRQVLQAAATMYAAGCRAGHRTSPSLIAANPSLRKTWAAADPLAHVPRTELDAGRHARTGDGQWASHAAMTSAIDAGYALQPGLGQLDAIVCSGSWWMPASAGWIRTAQPGTRPPLEERSPSQEDTTSRGADQQ